MGGPVGAARAQPAPHLSPSFIWRGITLLRDNRGKRPRGQGWNYLNLHSNSAPSTTGNFPRSARFHVQTMKPKKEIHIFGLYLEKVKRKTTCFSAAFGSSMRSPVTFQHETSEVCRTSQRAAPDPWKDAWRSLRLNGTNQEYTCPKFRKANGAPLRHDMRKASRSVELRRVTAAPLRRSITFSNAIKRALHRYASIR
jgi:hypothetical protein